tara:strand:- start:1415 stop:1771 length:357 start_codon:yes stop_codon:yes gene_type:complete
MQNRGRDMAEDIGQDANIFPDGLPVFIYTFLEHDDDGVLQHETTLSIEGEEDVIVTKGFYEIIDDIKEEHADNNDYNALYEMAAELNKEAERLREEAERIENSTRSVADLFNANAPTA